MPPKRQPKRQRKERFRCDQIEGEKFHAQVEDVFKYNWWEVFCFPYILCARIWDCCISLCSGTNQCLIYWMMIQWVVCKITRITTPDPIIFPYYFYMFCQVILLTTLFIVLWNLFGMSVLIPYFEAFYNAFNEEEAKAPPKRNVTRLSFRRYCFRKGDIFDTSIDSGGSLTYPNYATTFFVIIIDFFLYKKTF